MERQSVFLPSLSLSLSLSLSKKIQKIKARFLSDLQTVDTCM